MQHRHPSPSRRQREALREELEEEVSLLTPLSEVAAGALEYAEVAVAPCSVCATPWHTHLMALEAGGYRCPSCELAQGAAAQATREARNRVAGLIGMTLALLALWASAAALPMPRWMVARMGPGSVHMLPLMTQLVVGGLMGGAAVGALRESRQAADTVGLTLTRWQRFAGWVALLVSVAAVLAALSGLGPA